MSCGKFYFCWKEVEAEGKEEEGEEEGRHTVMDVEIDVHREELGVCYTNRQRWMICVRFCIVSLSVCVLYGVSHKTRSCVSLSVRIVLCLSLCAY